MTTIPNVSNTIDNEFRWETLLTRVKKSSILVERIQSNTNPMLNFGLEKILIEYMKTMTEEEQTKIEFESLIVAGIRPLEMPVEEFESLKHELFMEHQSSQVQFDYAIQFSDESQQIKWLTKAAEKQNKRAQYRLAYIYDEKKDYKQAVFWYTKCSELGCKLAKNNLAVCYRQGQGVEKDEKKAFQLYTESANDNNSVAQKNLGRCYEFGFGVEKNEKLAAHWYSMSTNNKKTE